MVVDAEQGAEAGEAALGGEGEGPITVAGEADGEVQREAGGGECQGCAGEDGELCGDGFAAETAGEEDGGDAGQGCREEEQADVLLEEERKDAGCAGEEGGDLARPAMRAGERICGAEEEVESGEDGEDAVGVVDGVGVEAVEAEGDERGGEERGEAAALGQDAEADAPGEQGGGGVGERGPGDGVPVDAAEETDEDGLKEEGERRMGEGEVAVGERAGVLEREGEAVAAVEQVGEVPEDGDVGALPEGEERGGESEGERGEGVCCLAAEPPGGERGHKWIVSGGRGAVYCVSMQVTIEVPDSFVATLSPKSEDVARRLLEDAVAQAYREGKISSRGVRETLGMASRFEVDPFLQRYGICDYTPEMLQEDIQTLEDFHRRQSAEAGTQ